jgi:hypothetical protein
MAAKFTMRPTVKQKFCFNVRDSPMVLFLHTTPAAQVWWDDAFSGKIKMFKMSHLIRWEISLRMFFAYLCMTFRIFYSSFPLVSRKELYHQHLLYLLMIVDDQPQGNIQRGLPY